MTTTVQQSEFVTATQLKGEYHFTPSWMTRLGEPDMTKPNPNYRSGPPMCLYRRERVEQVVAANRAEYERRLAAYHRGSQRAQPEVERRRAERHAAIAARLAEAEAAPITVQRHRIETVRRDAIASHNKRAKRIAIERNEDWNEYNEASPPASLDRISVNYLRHHLTSYDRRLGEIGEGEGADLAAWTIRRRVFDKIAEAYPMLAEACAQQRAYRQMWEDLAREWNRRSSRG